MRGSRARRYEVHPIVVCSAFVQNCAVTQTEFITKIKLHMPQGCRASHEALALVTEAIRAFPHCAELWLLHGWVTMSASECDVSDGAIRSFEMAIKINPLMTEARAALDFYQRSMAAIRSQADPRNAFTHFRPRCD